MMPAGQEVRKTREGETFAARLGPGRNAWLGEARHIARLLGKQAVRGPDGHRTWVSPIGYAGEGEPPPSGRVGPHLYHGSVGIAVFFAALAKIDGDESYRELALEVIAPLRAKLREIEGKRLRLRLGVLIGLGSFLFSFQTIADLLDDPELARDAHALTELLTPELIAREEVAWIQLGSSGAILALLALNRRQPEANRAGRTPLDLARACAERTLELRERHRDLPRAWPLRTGSLPLLGYSYGAAGVANALQRLHRVSPDERWADAAAEAWRFVEGFYEPENAAWRDIRSELQAKYRPQSATSWKEWWTSAKPEPVVPLAEGETSELEQRPPFSRKWCHGSAGLFLARLEALGFEKGGDPESLRPVIESLRQSGDEATELDPAEMDDLCCGSMGSVETLMIAADRLGEPAYRDAAHGLARKVHERAAERGSYQLSAARGWHLFAPTLFQGISGVAYTYLRLAAPEDVPSLLLFE